MFKMASWIGGSFQPGDTSIRKVTARFDVSKASLQKLMIFCFPNSSIDT